MTAFRTVDDLKALLGRAGLGSFAEAVARSARPAILFLREQEPDDALPPTSKIGGHPDLPESFAWPRRGPYPDAAARAKDAMAFARSTADSWRPQVDGPLEPHQRRITQAEIDRLIPAAEARGRAFSSAFPLGFVGQLDLATLAGEPGFDPELPRSGVLSIFEDVSGEGLVETPVLFWHDAPAAVLRRTPPPAELVDHVDLCGSYGLGSTDPWKTLTFAETLAPFSAVAVPHHWKSAFRRDGVDWRRFWDWFQSPENGEYAPAAPSYEGHEPDMPQAGYFGDRLGGWPNPIQGDPETELDGRAVTTPGRTTWRHLFSHGGEYFGGTRRMGSDGRGDGTTYHLLEGADLAARRFEKARWAYQMD